jgi:acetylornithine deacetylase
MSSPADISQKRATLSKLYADAVELLQQLISVPSFSKEEHATAETINTFLQERGVETHRKGNNVWAFNKFYSGDKPTILLNSHHDTVKPNAGWTKDPFTPVIENGKLFGLGSNDAGGCLVSLIATFLYFYQQDNLPYNIVIAATAEEEISGKAGIESILDKLDDIDFAIVGEPTEMHMAIAEKGLMVLDCAAHGKAGHAARDEGENAIYKALKDIEWFRTYKFDKESAYLGPVKMSVTVIQAGSQHNVIPDRCTFTVDVRMTDAYTHEEVLNVIRQHVKSEVTPRSTRLKPSSIAEDHSFVQQGLKLGRKTFGSATTSDQALLSAPSLKMGPGDSLRSHTTDEYIYLSELEKGIRIYIDMLEGLFQSAPQQETVSYEALAKEI